MSDFKLSLQIMHPNASDSTVHIEVGQDDREHPMISILGTGFETDDQGAGDIADLLEDAAAAIREHLDGPEVDNDQERDIVPEERRALHSPGILAAIDEAARLAKYNKPDPKPRVPRFNPKPRGSGE